MKVTVTISIVVVTSAMLYNLTNIKQRVMYLRPLRTKKLHRRINIKKEESIFKPSLLYEPTKLQPN